MKPVKITVSTKEPGLALDLARGLADRGKGAMIMVAEAPEMCFGDTEVLVTDFDEKIVSAAGFGPSEVVWMDETSLPVSRLYEKIMDFVWNKRDAAGETHGFAEAGKHGDMRVISLFSRQGGSGVTALSVTLGRMLAGMYGEKVLYVCLSADDHSILYRDRRADSQNGPLMQELLYRMSRRRPFCIERFTERDMYGLEYLCCGNEACSLESMDSGQLDSFLKEVGRAGNYRWILLDAGTRKVRSAGMQVEICSQTDCRSRAGMTDRQDTEGMVIWNRCCSEQRTGNGGSRTAGIPEDPGSFLTEEAGGQISDGIEICMTKAFASGVRTIAAQFMNDDSFGVQSGIW